jgi:hypothetical protein
MSDSLQSGLTHYYSFNESSGTNAVDSRGKDVGVQANGTITHNSVNFTTGKIGNAMDGRNNTVPGTLNITNGSAFGDIFNGTTSMSVSFWFNLGSEIEPVQSLVGKGHNTPHGFFRIGGGNVPDDGFAFANLSLYMESDSGGRTRHIAKYTLDVTDTWIHAVMTYNGTPNTNGAAKFYINGVLQNSSLDGSAFSGGYTGDDYVDLYTGYDSYLTSGQVANASIDELGFWNRELSQAEVTSLYNNAEGITYRNQYTNSSIVPAGTNFTNVPAPIGENSLVLFCNDSLGNLGQSSTNFTITPPVLLTINSPLNQTYATQSINFNVSGEEAMQYCKFTINDWATNYTMTNVTPTTFNYTNNSMNEGSYTAQFWCNDSTNNVNETESILFTVDTTSPKLSIIYPVDGANYATNVSELNYTIDETSGYC